MRKILIAGKNSYIGYSFEKYLKRFGNSYQIDKISIKDDKWRNLDFSKYDVILDVAGIAHIKITPDMEDTFYKINRDLTVELCEKAKCVGVKQFIYLSSMNVYGDTSDLITKDFKPCPKNFYGNSKLQADEAIHKMSSNFFKVSSIRPPVVYGPGCKGNYQKLSKLARWLPIFPNFKNTRSMIYIDNLCELIRLIIDNFESGIFHPQNREYTSTFELTMKIAEAHKHKIITTGLFNLIIRFLVSRVNIINRAFADDRYDMKLSNYRNFEYCIVGFEESVRKTEFED